MRRYLCGSRGIPAWPTAFYDQVYLVPVAQARSRTNPDDAVDREFGEELRSPNFPSGWFILPFAAVFFLTGFAALM